MPQHSANEQYLLELINADRAKAGVQPLAFDNDLSESAEGHSRWMLAADVFSHTGSGGSSPTARMRSAGYTFEGSWATGENIAWATTRAPTGYADEVRLLHTNLMNSPGHRANLLSNNFREVGLGFEVGDYRGRSSAFVTENFAKSGSDIFLTGVAFDDRDGDRFYDPGEGLSNISVTVRNTTTGATYKATTMEAGGYDLALKAGNYTVTFSGAGIETSSKSVSIGSRNVKLDLVDPNTGTVAGVADSGAAPQTEPSPEPAPAPQPAPQPVTNPWLADFFKRSGSDSRTLAATEEGNAQPGEPDAGSQRALDGDSLAFQLSRKVPANFDEIADLARNWTDGAVEKVAAAWETMDQRDGHGLWHDDAPDMLTAKILAHFSASQAGLTPDLV